MAQIEIDEVLNSIRSENAVNNEMFGKTLADINAKLEDIADDGITAELVKTTLENLKAELETRHRFSVEKFESIKEAFENLNENQELLTKNSDLKIMFNILNENIDNFAQEINDQKALIEDIETKLTDFRNDTSKKDEIIEKVSVVKDGIDEVNRGLQSSIMEVNSTLRGITKTLLTMDVTDQNDIIKRELENIYLAENAILSSMEILDQKNDDIAKNLISKEDLIDIAGKIDNSFSLVAEKIESFDNSEKIITEIEKNRSELLSFNESVSKGLSEYLNSVRDVLSNCIEEIKLSQANTVVESDSIARQKFENLERLSDDIKKIDTSISNQSESYVALISTKIKELGSVIDDFKSYIDDSHTDIEGKIEAKLLEVNSLVSQSSDVIGGKFEELQSKVDKTIQSIETFAEDNSIKLGNSISEITDIKSEIARIFDNMTSFNSNQDAHLSNLDGRLDNDFGVLKDSLNGFCSNFETLKYTLEQSNLDNRELLTDIVNEAYDKTKELIEVINNDSVENAVKNVDVQVGLLKEQLVELNNVFTVVSAKNVENILANIEKSAGKIDTLGENLTSVLENNFESVKDSITFANSDNKQQIEQLGDKFTSLSQQNAGNILTEVKAASSKIDILGVDLSTEIDNSFEMVRDFIETTKDEKNQNSVEIAALSENIKKLEADFSKKTDNFKTALEDQMASLKEYIAAVKECKEETEDSHEFEKLAEKMLTIETALHEAGENFGDNLMMVQNKISDYAKSVEYISKETGDKLETSLNEIASIKTDLLKVVESITNIGTVTSEKIDDTAHSLISKFDEIVLNITEIKDDVTGAVSSSLQKNVSIIDEKMTSLQELLNDNNLQNFDRFGELDESVKIKIDDLKQEIGLVNTDISEILTTKTAALAEDFVPLKESIDNFLNADFNNIIDGIKSQIELSYLSFSADVNENLTENHDNYIHLEKAYNVLTDKFTKVEEVINDLSLNQIGVMTSTIKEVENNITNNFEKTNNLLKEWQEDLKKLEGKIDLNSLSTDNALDDILKKLTALSQRNNGADKAQIQECIAELLTKEDFVSRFDYFDTEITSKLKIINEELSSGNEASDLALKNLKTLLTENLNSINEKVDILALSDTSDRIDEMMQALHEKIDILAVSGEDEKVAEMLQALHEKVDVLVMSDEDEKLGVIEGIIKSLNEKIDVLALTGDDEHIEELMQSLHDKVDVIASSDNEEKIEELVQSLHDKVDVLASTYNEEKIENMVQALHDKVDIIALSDDAELYTEIQDIKGLIFEQRKQIEEFGITERSASVDKRLQELFDDISNIENRLTGLDFEKNASDIKDAVMNALISVADQITFVEETEEIKGFVEERTDIINKNLLDVKKQLSNIACSSEAWDYSYTMQDIESDIAKLRIILNDISTSTSKDEINEISQNMHKIAASVNTLHTTLTEEQILELKNDIEKINEDVISLSSRTNKLLLTSDESFKALTDGLDEFSRIIDKLDNTNSSEAIEQKLESIHNAVTSSANSDSIMRQAMMYLGEWIDDATEKLDTIANDTSNVSIINSEICLLKSMVDNTAIVESLEKKFNEQQNRINILERKLDSVLNIVENQNNTGLQNKLDELDEKMSKLSKGIEKLASYVDEE